MSFSFDPLEDPQKVLDNVPGGAVVHAIISDVVVMLQMVLLHLLLEHLQLSYSGYRHLILVRHQGAVEVNGEGHEDDHHRDEDHTGRPGRRRTEVIELHPAQDGYLQEEEYQAQQRGEGPRRLDIPVQALVRRFVDQGNTVQITHRLDIWQDAGADHQGQHVHGHQERGADGEGYQHARWHVCVVIQLHLHHRHLRGIARSQNQSLMICINLRKHRNDAPGIASIIISHFS